MIEKILVVGGTCMLGQPVVARLLADGYHVKVLTHSLEKARNIFGEKAELATGDVTDIETLREPMSGCDAVYINLNAKMNPPDYEKIETLGTANVAAIAAEQGIRQIAMISGLNVSEEHTKFPFMVAKAKAEKAVINSGIPYTIFKCCWFFESLPLFIIDKRATIIGKQPHKRFWLAADDFAPMVSKAFSNKNTLNKVFRIRGIDRYTIEEALTGLCEIVFPDAKVSKVPLWIVSMMSKINRKKVTGGMAQFMKFFELTPDNEMLDDAEQILGPCLTTLKDWAENYRTRLMVK